MINRFSPIKDNCLLNWVRQKTHTCPGFESRTFLLQGNNSNNSSRLCWQNCVSPVSVSDWRRSIWANTTLLPTSASPAQWGGRFSPCGSSWTAYRSASLCPSDTLLFIAYVSPSVGQPTALSLWTLISFPAAVYQQQAWLFFEEHWWLWSGFSVQSQSHSKPTTKFKRLETTAGSSPLFNLQMCQNVGGVNMNAFFCLADVTERAKGKIGNKKKKIRVRVSVSLFWVELSSFCLGVVGWASPLWVCVRACVCVFVCSYDEGKIMQQWLQSRGMEVCSIIVRSRCEAVLGCVVVGVCVCQFSFFHPGVDSHECCLLFLRVPSVYSPHGKNDGDSSRNQQTRRHEVMFCCAVPKEWCKDSHAK